MARLAAIWIRSSGNNELPDGFPFSVSVIASLAGRRLEFPTPVTFFVGENGSGKSTLLEALAWATDLPVVGRAELAADRSLGHARILGDALALEWAGPRMRHGFFLRAEDFFGFAQRMDAMRAELEEDLARLDADSTLSSVAKGFARQAPLRELGELRRRYGEGIDTRSHGEQFLNLFGSSIRANGLYLLDEPEAPLSPNRQLSLVSMIMHLSREEGAQFVIATHSPIVLAVPGATIYTFDGGEIREAGYESLEHVRLTRDFLNDREAFLRHL
jgi:predicted ATPase